MIIKGECVHSSIKKFDSLPDVSRHMSIMEDFSMTIVWDSLILCVDSMCRINRGLHKD